MYNRLNMILCCKTSFLDQPKWLGSLANLTHLYLAGNNMEELPEDVDRLANLCYLELSRNRLQALPHSVTNLKRLSHLIVDFNSLQALPKGTLIFTFILSTTLHPQCSCGVFEGSNDKPIVFLF